MLKYIVKFLSIIYLIFSSNIAFAQSIGSTVEVDDTVSGRSGKLQKASTIYVNERIRSNASGLGHFKFNDGTKMVVGPNSNLVLNNAIYNPGGSSFKKFVVQSTAGAARFISGSSRSTSYEIQTPVGTLGIRGTAFDIHHFKGRTHVILVSGRVEVCSRTGKCQTLKRKCDFVTINRAGNVSKPVQPKDSGFERRDVALFFPLISDQRNIRRGYRLRARTCGLSGGRSFKGFIGGTDATGAGDGDIGGGAEGGSLGGDPAGGDDGGDDGGNDGGDTGGDTGGDDGGEGDAGDTAGDGDTGDPAGDGDGGDGEGV